MQFRIGKVKVLTFAARRANGKWFSYMPLRPRNASHGARVICLPFINIYIAKGGRA